ncbi:MAG: hypothetical protein J0J06_08225 [Sphingomonas sp.]|uniref:hypothetical protein n=1 Tax=Sphingomonas sp. TaxID=28214 RepID=UPI001ACEDF95|nr:hypothetical protein [Sphingomonas sp.]MBN8815416.1 hypothetical protein [Sphingomonas sp.]
MGIASRGVAIIGLAIMLLAIAQPAVARERSAARPDIAAARFGVINGRTPRLGPKLVRRGGYLAITDMVRPRFVGGMIDIYPSTKTGFRLSVGDRYFAKVNFWRDAEQATHGLLLDSAARGGVGAQQRIYRRRTPAAVVGYDTELAPNLVVGLEGGTLFGRAISRGPRIRMSSGGDRAVNRAGLNPIATFAVRLAF